MMEYSKYEDVAIAKGVCGEEDYETKIFLYALDGLMIDSGPKILEQDVVKFFEKQNIDQVVLTHNHEDHAGTAPWILKNTKVPVYLNAGAISSAHQPPVMDGYVTKMWGIRDTFDPQPLPEKLVTRSGKYVLETIETPGHLPYHNCFIDRERGWLFTGDLYLGTKLFISYKTENVGQMIVSIEKVLADYEFDTIFCAHAGVVEGGKARLNKKLLFLQDLQKQTRELRAQGMDDHAIAGELIPFMLTIEEISGGDWSRYNIIHTL